MIGGLLHYFQIMKAVCVYVFDRERGGGGEGESII